VKFTGTKAGDRTELTGLKIPFRWCPSGTFTMGTPGATNDEAPVSVTLSSGFWLGETEATQAQWTAIMKTTPWSGEARTKTGPDYPATSMSWDEAVAYCKKLTEQERAAGRLPVAWQYATPTEAQWEYACRAGTTTPYCFGESDSRLGDYGWFAKNADNANEQYAHRVGLKLANPWGLRDMHGNVHEWCQDWYVEKLAGGRDPSGPAQGTLRVLRDGSWNAKASACRSACRLRRSTDRRSNPLGFRVAVVPTRQ
jgi:formylglycine-generating enzyme required for sulfatase activity